MTGLDPREYLFDAVTVLLMMLTSPEVPIALALPLRIRPEIPLILTSPVRRPELATEMALEG
jgi:hypothetical protein